MPRKPETVYGWKPRYGKRAVIRANKKGEWLSQSLQGKFWGMNPVKYFKDSNIRYRRVKK